MDLPLYVRIEDVFTTDTLALEFADDNEENTNEFIGHLSRDLCLDGHLFVGQNNTIL